MKIRKVAILIGAMTICIVMAFLVFSPTQKAKADNVLDLTKPQFLLQMQANSTDSFIGDKLDEEAGISAYYKAPDAIDLDQVRSVFRTIELETANFIIGSVPVVNYTENFDTHVYVNTNGWILAYYLREDNVSKIVDIYNNIINTTKFTTVIATVASAAGAPFTDETYYDFRYPNATNMLLVYEDGTNGNDFTIQIPSTYGYFERGWALHDIDCWVAYFVLDDIYLLDAPYTNNCMYYGEITASQLLPDVTHTIRVETNGVLILIYRVP